MSRPAGGPAAFTATAFTNYLERKAAMRKAPLTKAARTWLVDNLTQNARNAAYLKRVEAEDALARDVLAHFFGTNWQARFAAIPAGWLPDSDSLCICDADGEDRLKDSWRLRLAEKVPVPYCLLAWQGYRVEVPDFLRRRLDAADAALREEGNNISKLHDELRSSLAAIRTLDALKEAWPEAYDLLPDEYKGGTYPLPAGRIEETLRLYGLLVSDFAPPRQDVAVQPVD